jgi:hypothetical protein
MRIVIFCHSLVSDWATAAPISSGASPPSSRRAATRSSFTSGIEMARLLRAVVADGDLARALSESGRRTVLARHTCAHRVDELMAIHAEIAGASAVESRLEAATVA